MAKGIFRDNLRKAHNCKKLGPAVFVFILLFTGICTYLSVSPSSGYESRFIVLLVLFLTLILLLALCTTDMSKSFNITSHDHWVRFSIVYVFMYALMIACTYLPADCRPIIGIAMSATVLYGVYMGVISNILFSSSYILLSEGDLNGLLAYLIVGTIACIIYKYYSGIKNIIYTSIILIVSNISLYLLFDYGNYSSLNYEGAMRNSISVIMSIMIAVTVHFYCVKYTKGDSDVKTLIRICKPNFPPLAKFKQKANIAYVHCVKVSELSYHVAKAVGANCYLAKAGGLYHEIGKSVGSDYSSDYINDGVEICKRFKVPSGVIKIIIEHNGRSQNPGSLESLIVMLADSVVSTGDYVKTTQKRAISNQRIVENVMNLRLESGDLDELDLTVGMYNKLKQAFLEEI